MTRKQFRLVFNAGAAAGFGACPVSIANRARRPCIQGRRPIASGCSAL